jgi:hypothetical protein
MSVTAEQQAQYYQYIQQQHAMAQAQAQQLVSWGGLLWSVAEIFSPRVCCDRHSTNSKKGSSNSSSNSSSNRASMTSSC